MTEKLEKILENMSPLELEFLSVYDSLPAYWDYKLVGEILGVNEYQAKGVVDKLVEKKLIKKHE